MKTLLVRIAAVTPLFALLSVSPLRADFKVPSNLCGGSSFHTCASVQLTWVNANTATLRISNAGLHGLFTAVGLSNLPDWATLASTRTRWGWAPNSRSDGTFPGRGHSNRNSKAEERFDRDDAPTHFDFTFTAPLKGWESVGAHATRGPHGACPPGKLNGSTNAATNSVGCGNMSGNMSTVPEPATMGLVASGLAALGGGGFLRRRRKA